MGKKTTKRGLIFNIESKWLSEEIFWVNYFLFCIKKYIYDWWEGKKIKQ